MELLQEAQEEKRRAEAEKDRARDQAEKAHYLAMEEAHRKDIAAKENLARLERKSIEENRKLCQELDELKKSRSDVSGLPPMPPCLDHNPWHPGYLVA